MLEVVNLHVHYGRIQAARGISLNVTAGEMVCVIGPNGAGKSTTLTTIAGATSPSSGEIRLSGASLVGQPPESIARLGVSLIPEGRHVFTQLTVKENMFIGTAMLRDRRALQTDFELMLEHFPFLQSRLSTLGGKLSGGEQQQLVIARALMTRPKIILIDEPSLGLAPLMIDRVYEILLALKKAGTTLLVVEQSAHRALENADRIYVLRGGRVQFHGKASELTEATLEKAYFGFNVDSEMAGDVHF
jgi:branched-chain amino acid transport system ATP-binding protein